MRNEGLGSWPARRARKTPRRTALIHENTTITYSQLYERTTRLAHALRARGAGRGDRIAYLGPNHPSYLETFFAAGTLGAVFVPLNTRLAGPEIAYQLTDSGAKILVHAPSHAGLVAGLPGTTDAVRYIEVGPAYEELITSSSGEPIDEPVTANDVCIIMYTSGTTGRPKGAMLTHGNLTWNAVNVLVDSDLASDERALVAAPLFHCAALNMLAMPTLLKGGACVLVDAFDAGSALELTERYGITFIFGVPTMFDLMARHPSWPETDLSSLRTLLCGGSPVPTPLIDAYQERGLAFQQGYGMTEATPGVCFLDAEHSVTKAGSAGVPHFFTDVRVVHPDSSPAGPGEPGEVLVSGPNVMPGYWGLPEATAAVLTDGWYRSGDVARLDDDGYVYIVDRMKDLIISGGENVYPAEVEDRLLTHPDIVDCAVIGVPDDKWGEAPHAVVVHRPDADLTPDDVIASLAGRLAKYKIPKSVVLITDELPRNASGKLLKSRIRDLYGG
ncbi:acyl-CoA synthetase [Streptomyces sp. bgisy027]|uniref:acyl-CoA synthetase n=1 Tax=unclassified Streptomyces TaxID=2593676 RepID=UPI003D72B9C8